MGASLPVVHCSLDSYRQNDSFQFFVRIAMSAALGHCEDPACLQSSSSPELVRLFRCSIHCNRNVCLFHLNAHNISYEEEKKHSDLLIDALQHHLSVYQSIFEQHIQAYRELVHQATSLLLRNTSTLVPIEQIRPVLEHIEQAISVYQDEKTVIKCEPILSMKDVNEPAHKVVVRLQRIDCVKEDRTEKEESTSQSLTKRKGDKVRDGALRIKRLHK